MAERSLDFFGAGFRRSGRFLLVLVKSVVTAVSLDVQIAGAQPVREYAGCPGPGTSVFLVKNCFFGEKRYLCTPKVQESLMRT